VKRDGRSYRLEGYDTAETYFAKCEQERQPGEAATARHKELIATAETRLEPNGKDCKWGRECARLFWTYPRGHVDGVSTPPFSSARRAGRGSASKARDGRRRGAADIRAFVPARDAIGEPPAPHRLQTVRVRAAFARANMDGWRQRRQAHGRAPRHRRSLERIDPSRGALQIGRISLILFEKGE
jgi:hypothetical protein